MVQVGQPTNYTTEETTAQFSARDHYRGPHEPTPHQHPVGAESPHCQGYWLHQINSCRCGLRTTLRHARGDPKNATISGISPRSNLKLQLDAEATLCVRCVLCLRCALCVRWNIDLHVALQPPELDQKHTCSLSANNARCNQHLLLYAIGHEIIEQLRCVQIYLCTTCFLL